jgi:NAD(P)-dependent dehydrogenase (short-subunit alcohol dehydrogenase family)
MKLKDKVASITGGAQGFGKAIALAMANEGADIVV